jgi:endonuclease/exonuclease/phosphatase family metal-dependent hydrolase
VEAEDRPTLLRFNDQVLGAEFQRAFDHVMLIDGNDDRGIDVGLLSRFPLNGMRSHVDDRNPNGERTFSRDCPEYLVALPNGQRLAILPNHFKSKRGGNDHRTRARRLAQAVRSAALATAALQCTALVLLGGDLNATPGSPSWRLWRDGFTDVQSHPSYPADRPGTFDTGTGRNKIDYLIMSPALHGHLEATGI